MSLTLANIRDAVRQLADKVGDNHCTDTEINTRISFAASDLWDRLCVGDGFAVKSKTFSLASGNTYDLATNVTDFMRMVGLDYTVGNCLTQVVPFEWSERHRFANGLPGVGDYTLWYVPTFAGYTSDSTTEPRFDPWIEYIVVEGAIRCLSKEESSVADLERRKAEIVERIDWAAQQRAPHRIADAHAPCSWAPDGRAYCLVGQTLYIYQRDIWGS